MFSCARKSVLTGAKTGAMTMTTAFGTISIGTMRGTGWTTARTMTIARIVIVTPIAAMTATISTVVISIAGTMIVAENLPASINSWTTIAKLASSFAVIHHW